MSFILDALKKSEHERQRQATPGFIETPIAHRRGRVPVWVWIIGAVLVVNVAVLSVLLWRSQRAPAPGAASARAAKRTAASAAPAVASGSVNRPVAEREPAPDTDSAGAPANEHFSPLDAAPVYAPEIPVDSAPRSTSEPRATSDARPVPPLVAGTGARSPRRGDPTLIETPQDKPENDEVLPSINELNLQGQQALPDIHLDVHVFASRPADRFVYINMRKYREGATLQEGPLLEHIRRDGVVLNYRGVRFLLPRQ